VSTPSQCCHQPSAYRCYAISHVLSSWFRTTSTVYSTQSLRAYCIPLSTMGFATFPFQFNLRSTRETGREKNFPATLFIPLEEYPSSAAVSCHHDRYLHAVVESCSNTKASKTTPSRLQGLTPLMNSQCCHVVSNTTTPDPSMGFVPLQDPQSVALHKTNLAVKSRH